jgi:hypothetical protein
LPEIEHVQLFRNAWVADERGFCTLRPLANPHAVLPGGRKMKKPFSVTAIRNFHLTQTNSLPQIRTGASRRPHDISGSNDSNFQPFNPVRRGG